MTAITRSAASTLSSISLASSEASATEWMGTLRTSMALGIGASFPRVSVGYDDGAGAAGESVDDRVEVGDDRGVAGGLDEPQRRLDLRAHRAAGEVPVRGVAAERGDGDPADRILL